MCCTRFWDELRFGWLEGFRGLPEAPGFNASGISTFGVRVVGAVLLRQPVGSSLILVGQIIVFVTNRCMRVYMYIYIYISYYGYHQNHTVYVYAQLWEAARGASEANKAAPREACPAI